MIKIYLLYLLTWKVINIKVRYTTRPMQEYLI